MTRASLAAVLCFAAKAAVAQGIEATDAYVPQSPPGAMSMAAYMHLENVSDRSRSLIGVDVAGFGAAHLHSSALENGVATMAMVHQLDIAPRQTVKLEPGGLHIMLMRPDMRSKVGDIVELKLLFADGETLDVEARVQSRGKGS